MSEAMGGTSGAIVEIMFRAMVSYFIVDENAVWNLNMLLS